MNKFLSFHHHETSGNEVRMAPAYYIEADYSKVAVRIYAKAVPLWEARFDIFNDGISIFTNNTPKVYATSGVDISRDDDTTIFLSAGENSEEFAEDFTGTPIERDSWVYCNMVDAGGGSGFTVQLELRPMSEDDDSED